MPRKIVRHKHKRCGNGLDPRGVIAIGKLINNMLPPDWKRKVAIGLTKDLAKVGIPVASAIGAKKLYNKHKKK